MNDRLGSAALERDALHITGVFIYYISTTLSSNFNQLTWEVWRAPARPRVNLSPVLLYFAFRTPEDTSNSQGFRCLRKVKNILKSFSDWIK
jgi:hypothetical protein